MTKTEEFRRLNINGVEIAVYADGSIKKPSYGKRIRRTFGWVGGKGYLYVNIVDKKPRVHRLVARAFLDDYSDSLQVDHINGDKLDNRVENLRMVTNQQNSQAFARKRKSTSSKYRGVSLHKPCKRWQALVSVDGKQQHLGYFDDELDAAMAWNKAALKYGFSPEALNSIPVA